MFTFDIDDTSISYTLYLRQADVYLNDDDLIELEYSGDTVYWPVYWSNDSGGGNDNTGQTSGNTWLGEITVTDDMPTGTLTFRINFQGLNTSYGDTITETTSGLSITIDTMTTVENVTSTTANGSYKEGDEIDITIEFSRTVYVTTTNGTPQLTLETGDTDAVVDYTSGSGTDTLTFTYTVADGNTSSDLDYTSTSALALNLSLIHI